MVESRSNSDSALGENGIQRQIELVTRISQVSDDLSLRFKERETRLLNPKFSIPPPILLDGLDVSEKLHAIVQKVPELLVRFHELPEKNDVTPQAACRVWEINPSKDKKLPGFGLTVVVPQLTEKVTSYDLKQFRDTGSTDVVDMLWFESGETFYNPTNPENILLDNIRKDPTASLQASIWILESLQSDEVIHGEKEI